MKREEDRLREACAQLAREEADQFERSLTRADLRLAEELYRRHRRKALSLIRRNADGGSAVKMWTRIAAALAILAGGIYLALGHSSRETVPQGQISLVTVAPYYSPSPSPSPSTETVWAISATPPPNSDIKSIISATNMPGIEEKETDSPTFSPFPTSAPTPTATPTEEPSPTPSGEPVSAPSPTLPEDWTGSYFPMGLLDENASFTISKGDGWQQAACGGWIFTEYADGRVLDAVPDARLSYVQWHDTVALRMETENGVTLTWVQDGHSMRLYTGEGNAAEMAKTVKKISGE